MVLFVTVPIAVTIYLESVAKKSIRLAPISELGAISDIGRASASASGDGCMRGKSSDLIERTLGCSRGLFNCDHHAKSDEPTEKGLDGSLNAVQAAGQAGDDQGPGSKSDAQRIRGEREPIHTLDAKIGELRVKAPPNRT
jgi:hypothetical protein